MEINRKTFLAGLSRIKASKDVIVLRDSPVDGCLDILYSPKCQDTMPRCVHKMTICLGGAGADLFDDATVEKLGKPVPVFLSRVKEVLRDAASCVLKDGCVNGIRVEVGKSDMNYSMFKWVLDIYKNFSGAIENTQDFESVNLRKIDYSYMVSECSKL